MPKSIYTLRLTPASQHIDKREIHIIQGDKEKVVNIKPSEKAYRLIAEEKQEYSIFIVDSDKDGNKSVSETLEILNINKPAKPVIEKIEKVN